MRYLCILFVVVGAAILLYSIVRYYRELVRLKIQSNEQKIFMNWIYTACMFLMVFFLIGYVIVAFGFFFQPQVDAEDFLVANIFLFGAVFVLAMVMVEQRMSRTISRKTSELVGTLVNTVETKDQYTRGHSVHVHNITRLLFDALPEHTKHTIDKERLFDAEILHDVGKIGIHDAILNKPSKLTPEEWQIIKMHPKYGRQILSHTTYHMLSEIILCHHERMDGKGYYNVPAADIPFESRIIAVADTFSAIYTDRIYRPKRSFEEAIRIMNEVAGTQLDAELVKLFCQIPKTELDTAGIILFEQMDYSPTKAQVISIK